MKIFYTLITVLFLSLSLNAQMGKWRDKEMEVKVFINNEYDAQILAKLKLNGDIYNTGYALIYVIPKEFELLKTLPLKYQVLKEDLNEYYKDFWNSDVPSGYFTYQQIVDLADSLKTNFPSICNKISFGTSAGGLQLCALKISDNVTTDENESEVMFDAGIHGDEIGGPQNVMLLARELCKGYGTNPTYTNLINSREIWLYYMVNPDGRTGSMSRYNANGIDCNRNYYYMWNNECTTGAPISQPETKALYSCMYTNQFVVHTSYHSGIEYISYPWSYRPELCPDNNHINQLAGVYASNSGYTNIPYSPGYTGMYAINGSTKDGNYGCMGSVTWSMEISSLKQPPANQIAMYYNYNKPSMLKMIEYAGYGLEGVVTDAVSGQPIPAVIFVNSFFPCFTDPVVGDYHKYLTAGTYTLKVVANGYLTQTINNVLVNNLASTITNVQLQPSSGQFVYRVVGCQIPGNNFSDEGYTPAVIGAANNINYSLGKAGWIVLDMQTPIIDRQGNDIKVYEGDATPEGFSCYAGPTLYGPWTFIGTGTGTTEFDFENKISSAQFIKIVDDGDGSQTGADIGFDLDAIEALPHASGVYLTLVNYTISDPLPLGNNNGRLDPDETATITVNVKNNGDIVSNTTSGTLSVSSPYITLGNSTLNYGNIAPDATAQASFTLNTANNTPLGYSFVINQNISANSGSYTTSNILSFSVGLIVEDWKTNTFTKFPWVLYHGTNGGADWTLVSGGAQYEGSYCAKSGLITHSQVTNLEINRDLEINDSISFYKKVSSESTFDKLIFFIDNVQIAQWSGTTDVWSFVKYPINIGNHNLRWQYFKDGSVSNGSDCAWIDYIILPPTRPGSIEEKIIDDVISCYPNPAKNELSIVFNSSNYNLKLLSLMGNTVYQENNINTSIKTIDVSQLNAGCYFLLIESKGKLFTKKVLIQQ